MQLNGCKHLTDAIPVVGGLHSFFISRPQYLKLIGNCQFLEKYSDQFAGEVQYLSPSPHNLGELKGDAAAMLKLR